MQSKIYEKARCYLVCSWKLNLDKKIYYKGMQFIVSSPKSGQLARGQCQVQVHSKLQEQKSTIEILLISWWNWPL
jgi:hypothetical protein